MEPRGFSFVCTDLLILSSKLGEDRTSDLLALLTAACLGSDLVEVLTFLADILTGSGLLGGVVCLSHYGYSFLQSRSSSSSRDNWPVVGAFAPDFIGNEEGDVGCCMPEVRVSAVFVVTRTFTEVPSVKPISKVPSSSRIGP